MLNTGVKLKADVGCLQEPPRDSAEIGNCHSVYGIRERQRVWTAVWKASGDRMNKQIDCSRDAGDDVTVVAINQRREKMARLVSIQDHSGKETGGRTVR